MTRRITLAERRRRVAALQWAECAADVGATSATDLLWRTLFDWCEDEIAALRRAEKRAKGRKRCGSKKRYGS